LNIVYAFKLTKPGSDAGISFIEEFETESHYYYLKSVGTSLRIMIDSLQMEYAADSIKYILIIVELFLLKLFY